MKKKEQEPKIIICLYIIIVFFIMNTICNFIIISKMGNENKNLTNNEIKSETSTNSTYDTSFLEQLTPKEITRRIKNGTEIVLFIGQEKCSYCQKMLPVIKDAQNNFGYKTVYLNIASTDVTSSEYKEMASLLDVEKTSNGETKEFGQFQVTPMVAVIKNGKMVDGMIGYNTYDNFVKFLENSGIQKK